MIGPEGTSRRRRQPGQPRLQRHESTAFAIIDAITAEAPADKSPRQRRSVARAHNPDAGTCSVAVHNSSPAPTCHPSPAPRSALVVLQRDVPQTLRRRYRAGGRRRRSVPSVARGQAHRDGSRLVPILKTTTPSCTMSRVPSGLSRDDRRRTHGLDERCRTLHNQVSANTSARASLPRIGLKAAQHHGLLKTVRSLGANRRLLIPCPRMNSRASTRRAQQPTRPSAADNSWLPPISLRHDHRRLPSSTSAGSSSAAAAVVTTEITGLCTTHLATRHANARPDRQLRHRRRDQIPTPRGHAGHQREDAPMHWCRHG